MQIDHIIQHRRPEVALYGTERKCHLIDIAVSRDKKDEQKGQEKVDNESDLRQEVGKIWNLSQAVVVPVVIVATGVTFSETL